MHAPQEKLTLSSEAAASSDGAVEEESDADGSADLGCDIIADLDLATSAYTVKVMHHF